MPIKIILCMVNLWISFSGEERSWASWLLRFGTQLLKNLVPSHRKYTLLMFYGNAHWVSEMLFPWKQKIHEKKSHRRESERGYQWHGFIRWSKVSLTYTMFIGLGVWLIKNTTISLLYCGACENIWEKALVSYCERRSHIENMNETWIIYKGFESIH